MERSLLSALAGTLLGISALGSATFGSGSPSAQPKPEGDWHLLDPITYENISIFPVVSSVSQDTSAFVTLDEGLSSGDVLVREQGSDGMARSRGTQVPQYNAGASVNQLVLINRGKRPVLLLAGELVSGGKQDRIIAKDRIIAPGADPLPLDVFCVEHGRWSSGLQFSAAKTMVHPSVREQAAVNQSQSDVWESVRKGTTANVVGPPSASPRIAAADLADVVHDHIVGDVDATSVDDPVLVRGVSPFRVFSCEPVGHSGVGEGERRRAGLGISPGAPWTSAHQRRATVVRYGIEGFFGSFPKERPKPAKPEPNRIR